MIKFNERGFLSGIIFIFTAILMYQTFDMRSDVSLVPRLVGFTLLVFSGIQMLNDLFPAIQMKLTFLNKKTDSLEHGSAKNEEATGGEIRERWRFATWIIFFVVLIYFTKMVWAIPIAMFIYLKWISKESWKLSILYSVSMGIFVYLVFVVGFGIYYFA
jgi:hypothetical protein